MVCSNLLKAILYESQFLSKITCAFSSSCTARRILAHRSSHSCGVHPYREQIFLPPMFRYVSQIQTPIVPRQGYEIRNPTSRPCNIYPCSRSQLVPNFWGCLYYSVRRVLILFVCSKYRIIMLPMYPSLHPEESPNSV